MKLIFYVIIVRVERNFVNGKLTSPTKASLWSPLSIKDEEGWREEII